MLQVNEICLLWADQSFSHHFWGSCATLLKVQCRIYSLKKRGVFLSFQMETYTLSYKSLQAPSLAYRILNTEFTICQAQN